ncbi:MAG: hypothetical protein KDB79_16345 [Acidobacteria bacterium]|nr:hypothetical protein [Acidobacteriota bacterium]
MHRKLFTVIFVLIISMAIDAQTLAKRAADAYAEKDYRESARLFVLALENGEDAANNAYNAACSFALSGAIENAFRYLQRSVDLGYLNVSHMA